MKERPFIIRIQRRRWNALHTDYLSVPLTGDIIRYDSPSEYLPTLYDELLHHPSLSWSIYLSLLSVPPSSINPINFL